jgi:hypothetical protein
MSGEVWRDEGDELPPFDSSNLTWREAEFPPVGLDTRYQARRSAEGNRADEKPPSPGRRSRLPASSRRFLGLAAVAIVGVVALGFGLRAAGPDDAGSAQTRAAGVPPASATLPTFPPRTIPPPAVVTTAPALDRASSTSTSSTSTSVVPSSTTTPPTTRAPAGTTPTGYGPLCGFAPGATATIALNGVPAGTEIAGPDGCVSGTIATGR